MAPLKYNKEKIRTALLEKKALAIKANDNANLGRAKAFEDWRSEAIVFLQTVINNAKAGIIAVEAAQISSSNNPPKLSKNVRASSYGSDHCEITIKVAPYLEKAVTSDIDKALAELDLIDGDVVSLSSSNNILGLAL